MGLSIRNRKIKARHIGLAVSILVIAVAAFLVYRLSSTGAQGQVSPPEITPPPTPAVHLESDKGTYIGFSYPDSFSKIPTEKLSGNQLEAFAYLKKPSPFWYLNIAISRLPSGNLADDGSYNARQKDPAKYEHLYWRVNGNQVDVFSDKTAAYAKAAFVAQNHLMLSIALTADSSDNSLDPTLLNTLQSVYWLKD
jgi:hypothetical protein